MPSHHHKAVAHLRPNPDGSWEVHDLKDHLIHFAERAARFADEFGNGDWLRAAGLLHDLGKILTGFQVQCEQWIIANNLEVITKTDRRSKLWR